MDGHESAKGPGGGETPSKPISAWAGGRVSLLERLLVLAVGVMMTGGGVVLLLSEYSTSLVLTLLALFFMLLGGIPIYLAARGTRYARQKDWAPVFEGTEAERGGTARLRSEAVQGLPRVGKADLQETRLKFGRNRLFIFVIVLVITVFFVGLAVVQLTFLMGKWRDGDTQGMLLFGLSGIVLVGIGVFCLITLVYNFLILFNPRPEVTVSSKAVPLGDKLRLTWVINGRIDRMESLQVRLRGIEEVTYKGASELTTVTSTFYSMLVYEASDRLAIAEGNLWIDIPSDTMPTFDWHNKKVLWDFQFQGKISRSADLDESFRIIILPKEVV